MSIAARARGLTKIYGSGDAVVTALDGVDFDVTAGEFTAIMGPSGSGKSTLMHLLAALDTPPPARCGSETRLWGARRHPAHPPAARPRRFRLPGVQPRPDTHGTREHRPAAGHRRPGIDEEWFGRIVDVLALGDRLTHKPSELSGGQQQRVACARALMNRPDIVFGDEPTGNLDSASAAEVLSFLRRSVDEFGQTVVMVTHDAHAASYADRAVFLSDGRIVDEVYGATQNDLLLAMARIYPRHDQPTARGVYRDGGAAPAHPGIVDDTVEPTVERSIARRAALD
ncbi:ATP-binding cassette domain-containing protein [Tessaracoccus sp. HDW20]|nr:ATP-binding cassette domain-containing protein [Tessaracoccus coleopterorum]